MSQQYAVNPRIVHNTVDYLSSVARDGMLCCRI